MNRQIPQAVSSQPRMPRGSVRAHGGLGDWLELARAIFKQTRSLMFLMAICLAVCGCGATKSFTATEQLLVSDAVDSTVSKIDFRPLSGRRIFLDNTFLPSQKGVPNPNPQMVHSEYVTSSLRQQMTAAGVLICEKREDADIIVEARLGALGFDGHSVTYGLPASNTLSTAASTLSGSPVIPLLPELSFAKKEAKQGAAKIALFAYERKTMHPVWQSGIARSSSSARDTWVLGVGPLQYGTIYEGTRFAGGRIFKGPVSKFVPHEDDEHESLVDYKRAQVFAMPGENGIGVATVSAPATDGKSDGVTQANATAPARVPVPPALSPTTTAAPATTASATTATVPAATAVTAASPAPAGDAAKVGSVSAPATANPASLSSPPSTLTPSMHIDDRAKK